MAVTQNETYIIKKKLLSPSVGAMHIGGGRGEAKNMENKIQVAGTQITIGQLRMIQEDIATWKEAVMNADLVTRPNRQRLVELYKNIIKDSRLKSLKDKRIRSIKNTPCLYHDFDGQVNIETTAIFEIPWFSSLLTQIMEAKFWGFSVVEFYVTEKGITDIFLLPRQNINADRREILVQMGSIKGISYLQEPYSKFIVDIHAEDRLGLLLEAAPLVLYKRGAIADWAQFAELFGMPIREYQYNPNNPDARKEAEKAAKEAGSASYLVVPEGTGLKLHKGVEGSQTGGVYEAMRLAMNEELAILILGQTMTTTDGSSRSQAEVHESVEEDIHLEDRLWVEAILNHKIKPLLVKHGYKVADGYFEFDKTENIDIQTQLDMDIKLNAVVPIDPDYFASKYNVPLAKVKPQEPPPPATKNPKESGLKKKWQTTLTPSQKKSILSGNYEELLPYFAEAFYKEVSDNISIDFSLKNEYKIRTGLQVNAFEFASARYEYLKSKLSGLEPDSRKVVLAKYEGYLEVEKEHFAASAQMARQWLDFEANADEFPLLKYVTASDDHVRPNHRALNGVTLPITDAFWSSHTPPLGYRCRCTMQQLRSDAPTTPKSAIPKVNPDKPLFANNAGISGKAFIDKHTYFTDTDKAQVSKLAEQTRENFLNQTLKKVENQIKNKEVEHSYVFDKYSNELVYKAGDIGNVVFSESEKKLLENSYVTHNHTIVSTFSYNGDVTFALANNLAQIRVALPNNYVLMLIRPENGWGASITEVEKMMYELEKDIESKFFSYENYLNPTITDNEYNTYINEGLVIDLLNKLGLSIKKEKL
jgi:SPP1 gp7 family putative phage head morphogenesis protein